jgi:hypothetical protein
MNNYEKYSIAINAIYTVITLFIFIVALIQYRHSIKSAAVRASLDFLEKESSSGEARSARAAYRNIIENADKDHLESLLHNKDSKSEEGREIITSILNKYEYIATGINANAIDYTTFKKIWRSSAIIDWHKTKPFIDRLRFESGNNLYMKEFEMLIARLENDKRSGR